MSNLPETETVTIYQCWSQMIKSVLEYQWQLLSGQSQVGLRVVERTLNPLAGPANGVPSPDTATATEPSVTEKASALERVAAERCKKGFAPPPAIYRAPYRERIDWQAFPEWARPVDPEIFESCGHEG